MSKIFQFLIPLIYSQLCIILPIKYFEAGYSMTVFIQFTIPTIILFAYLKQYLIDNKYIKSFIITSLGISILSIPYEYVLLYFDAWNFDESSQVLSGIEIFEVPIEEFYWWFSATPFCTLVFLYYKNLLG